VNYTYLKQTSATNSTPARRFFAGVEFVFSKELGDRIENYLLIDSERKKVLDEHRDTTNPGICPPACTYRIQSA
jgi:hypothetical protein